MMTAKTEMGNSTTSKIDTFRELKKYNKLNIQRRVGIWYERKLVF